MDDDQTLAVEIQPDSKRIIFLRHLVGIAIVSLVQPPSLVYGFAQYLGRWIGTLLGTFAISGIISGLLYLFFTSSQKGRIGRTFLFCCWILAGLQLYGQWIMPDVMKRYSVSESHSESVNYPATIPSSIGRTDTTTRIEQDIRTEVHPQNGEQAHEIANHATPGHAQIPDATYGITDEELQAAGTDRATLDRLITGKDTGPRWARDNAAESMQRILAEEKREQERKDRWFGGHQK